MRIPADRTGSDDSNLWIASENDLGAVITEIDSVKPALLIIDSIQTMNRAAAEGAAGVVTQVREVAAALIRIAKERDITLSQLALAWLLHQPAMVSPIIGATRPEQVHENAKASEIALSADDLAQIETILQGTAKQ